MQVRGFVFRFLGLAYGPGIFILPKMKTAVLIQPGSLKVRWTKRPTCPQRGLIVKVTCCGICSSDARMVLTGHQGLVYPRVPGHEIAGVVCESRNRAFNIGDRVQIYPGINCGYCAACLRGDTRRCASLKTLGFSEDGGFSEYLPVTDTSVLSGGLNLIPQNITDEEATLTEPLASCINAQEKTRVKRGDTVLIIGGGPLGLLNSFIARKMGAEKVLISERNEKRLALVKEHGRADRVIDAGLERLPKIVSDETGGRGTDVVILASNHSNISNVLPLLAAGGRLSLFSSLSRESAATWFDVNHLHYRELEVSGAFGSTAAQNAAALKLIGEGLPVGELVTKRVGLKEIMDGIRYTSDCEGLKAVIHHRQ
jgi:L-iditol 2-dehydrogenase